MYRGGNVLSPKVLTAVFIIVAKTENGYEFTDKAGDREDQEIYRITQCVVDLQAKYE